MFVVVTLVMRINKYIFFKKDLTEFSKVDKTAFENVSIKLDGKLFLTLYK